MTPVRGPQVAFLFKSSIGFAIFNHAITSLGEGRGPSPGFHRLSVRGTWDKRWEYAPFPEDPAAAAHPPPVPPPPRT